MSEPFELTPEQYLSQTYLIRAIERGVKANGLTYHGLARQSGMTRDTVRAIRTRRYIPTIESIATIADVLCDTKMMKHLIDLRTRDCEWCHKPFLTRTRMSQEWGQRFCNSNHQKSHWVELKRPQRERTNGQKLEKLELEVSRLKDENEEMAATFARMCWSCEVDGICKTPDCALRTESPFPLRKQLTVAAA